MKPNRQWIDWVRGRRWNKPVALPRPAGNCRRVWSDWYFPTVVDENLGQLFISIFICGIYAQNSGERWIGNPCIHGTVSIPSDQQVYPKQFDMESGGSTWPLRLNWFFGFTFQVTHWLCGSKHQCYFLVRRWREIHTILDMVSSGSTSTRGWRAYRDAIRNNRSLFVRIYRGAMS